MGKNIAISWNLYCALRKRFELERSKVQWAYQKVVEMEKEKTSLSTEKKSGSHKKIKIERVVFTRTPGRSEKSGFSDYD